MTIAWLTPITPSHRMYRLPRFKAGPGGDENFSIGAGNARQQPSHNALGKGAVYHQRWEGEDATLFVDNGNLLLEVTCLPAAGELDDSIDYAVVVTLEVGQDIAVPVYERVRERLWEIVRARTSTLHLFDAFFALHGIAILQRSAMCLARSRKSR